ncbi:hypothetical protein LTR53_017295, partial [Teratosphaeriaceae sp. CCFEE 6253]
MAISAPWCRGSVIEPLLQELQGGYAEPVPSSRSEAAKAPLRPKLTPGLQAANQMPRRHLRRGEARRPGSPNQALGRPRLEQAGVQDIANAGCRPRATRLHGDDDVAGGQGDGGGVANRYGQADGVPRTGLAKRRA